VRAEGNELDTTCKDRFTNVVPTNIDMSRVLPADCIGAHDCRQIVFVDVRTTFLKVAEILKDSTDVHNLLSTLTCCHVFGFVEIAKRPPLNIRTKPV
jgi:hypothetical protein